MNEADIRDKLAGQLERIEAGLKLIQKEQYLPNSLGTRGFVDLLAVDSRRRWVLIELKRSDAAAREAIHEIYKYVEGVKAHLGARDDEIRAMVVSTEWKELLVPFSRFANDTNISVEGIYLFVDDQGDLTSSKVKPLRLQSGRVLSPWHEIALYRNEDRLQQGVKSYDSSCKAKGIDDYILVVMDAPDWLHDAAVLSTANAIANMVHGREAATESEISDLMMKMDRHRHLIYFVPILQTAEEYMDIIKRDDRLYEEARDFPSAMSGDELLNSLQSYALDANPKVDRDRIEIGYPAKFKHRLLETEKWKIREILRRGAFARNSVLDDEVILGEIAGEAGTSGQAFKRAIKLSDKAEFASALVGIEECLTNNKGWFRQISEQLREAQSDFPDASVQIKVFAPSTGLFTLYFSVTKKDGELYVPSYFVNVFEDDVLRRMYVGNIEPVDDSHVTPGTYHRILSDFYGNDVGMLLLNLTWGGYEVRDVEVLDKLNLNYSSFKVDVSGDDRTFYRMLNGRWRMIQPMGLFDSFTNYLQANERLVRIIVGKLQPRVGPLNDGSLAERQLDSHYSEDVAKQGNYYIDPPDRCDLCDCPLEHEPYMSDAALNSPHEGWGNLCADCTVYHSQGFGNGIGQLYKNVGIGRWLLVAGFEVGEGADED